ncbi:MAG: M23 family metallopeptidase, partial [Flavobacteriales bacterium]
EAYIYEPEMKAPPGVKIKVVPGTEKKITTVELFMVDDTPIKEDTVLKYNQTIKVKVYTQNMPKELLKLTLYEDDAVGGGHNPKNEKNKVAETTKYTNAKGFLWYEFKLNADFSKIANAMMDGNSDKLHEYYVLVESVKYGKKASGNVDVENLDYVKIQRVGWESPEKEKVIEEVVIKGKYKKQIGIDPIPDTGRSVSIVQEPPKVENLIDAYFAKKEYTKQTDEEAGTHEYTFANNNQNINKDNIARIIKDRIDASLKAEQKYAKLDTVKTALTKSNYAKGEKISFVVYKLGEEFKRINSAPLEDKVYLVATTMLLDGKQATITIKEKDGIIKGLADAVLNVLEITEEQMNQTSSQGEVQGTEKTEFSGTIQDGLVKIPIHLRPKSDEDLKQWKEKLAKGKEDGTYTYTFAGQTSIPNGSGDEKKRVAGIILNNSKNGLRGNPKIEEGKTAFIEDIENALTKEKYLAGETVTFKLYKKQEELLYLHVKAQGEKEHNKEFLKQDGAYFTIGDCIKLIWGEKFTDEERDKVIKIAENLELADNKIEGANWLMSIMALETGGKFDPSIQNLLGYTGLIQFGNGAATDMGTTIDVLKQMSVLEQLDYVEKYFKKYKSKLNTLTDLYLAVLYPAATGKGSTPNYIVFDASSNNSYNALAYKQNPAFHLEDTDSVDSGTGKTYVWEIGSKIEEWYKKGIPRKNKCCSDNISNGWHDPVDDPMLCLYTQNGNYRPRYNTFGKVRKERSNHNHQGVDLLAKPGTNVYACMNGTVVRAGNSGGGYGNVITIKIDNPSDLIARKRQFQLVYKDFDEMEHGSGYNEGGDLFIFYAHLHSVNVNVGDQVISGQVIGLNGTSGFGSTKDPHLHFEILNAVRATGLNNRVHPGLFCYYKGETEMSEKDKEYQKEVASKYWN